MMMKFMCGEKWLKVDYCLRPRVTPLWATLTCPTANLSFLSSHFVLSCCQKKINKYNHNYLSS